MNEQVISTFSDIRSVIVCQLRKVGSELNC